MLIHVGTCSFGAAPTRAVLLLSMDDDSGALQLLGRQDLNHENPGWILHAGGGTVCAAAASHGEIL